MCTRDAGLFDYVFRIDTELPETDIPEWMTVGNVVQLVDRKTFVFSARGATRKTFGEELTVYMTRVNPPESDWAAPFASRRKEFAARWYAFLCLVSAKTLRVKRLYRHPELKLIVALYVDGRDLSDTLRERGFAG